MAPAPPQAHGFASAPLPGANPIPPQADVRDLDGEDLLAEAEVYWTYGHWRDAMDLYRWWIHAHGTGPDHRTGRQFFDCCIHAAAMDAFVEMLDHLWNQRCPAAFLQEMAVMGLMHDPGNFDLIRWANDLEVESGKIEAIAYRVIAQEETPAEKKSKLWKRSRKEANHLARQNDAVPGKEAPLVIARAGRAGAWNRHSPLTDAEKLACGHLSGSVILDDSSTADEELFEAVRVALEREVHTRPHNLGAHVDLLRILHGEGMRREYATALLRLAVILLAADAGKALRRRMLAIGRLLGSSPIFDDLSVAGDDFETVVALASRQGLYVPENMFMRHPAWNVPLVREGLR